MPSRSSPFDAAYFGRFYESEKTRVHGAKEMARLARGMTNMIAWFGGELRNVLDVGAGPGHLRDWFATHRPHVRYVSTDVSAYACKQYGHLRRNIAKFRGRTRFDLVVCQGVLPYLDDDAATSAIANLAAMSRGFLYLEAITERDLREVCNRELTDGAVHERTGAWYRERLLRDYHFVGCGLYYVKSGELTFYELEAGGG